MANEDTFINEVTEEVRRDRLFALMRRYGWIAALLIVLIVAGAALFEWRKAQAATAAQVTGDALIAALSETSPEARTEALAAVDVSGNVGQQAVTSLLQSAAALEVDDSEMSSAALDNVIGNTDIPQVYRDLAVLKRVMTSTDTSPEDRIARLQPLLVPGNPFRLLAVEQRALAEVEMGQTDAAIESLQGILADADRTEDLRLRAQRLIVALGGSIENG